MRKLGPADEMVRQMPLFVAVAALGGTLGAAFNRLRRALWPLRAPKAIKWRRFAEALGVAALCMAIKFALAHWAGRCVDVPELWDERGFEVCVYVCVLSYSVLPGA
jgi:hypothetical protein